MVTFSIFLPISLVMLLVFVCLCVNLFIFVCFLIHSYVLCYSHFYVFIVVCYVIHICVLCLPILTAPTYWPLPLAVSVGRTAHGQLPETTLDHL